MICPYPMGVWQKAKCIWYDIIYDIYKTVFLPGKENWAHQSFGKIGFNIGRCSKSIEDPLTIVDHQIREINSLFNSPVLMHFYTIINQEL